MRKTRSCRFSAESLLLQRASKFVWRREKKRRECCHSLGDGENIADRNSKLTGSCGVAPFCEWRFPEDFPRHCLDQQKFISFIRASLANIHLCCGQGTHSKPLDARLRYISGSRVNYLESNRFTGRDAFFD